MQGRMTFRPYGARIHFGIPNPPAYAGGYRQAAPYGAFVFGFAKNGDAGCGFVSSATKRGMLFIRLDRKCTSRHTECYTLSETRCTLPGSSVSCDAPLAFGYIR